MITEPKYTDLARQLKRRFTQPNKKLGTDLSLVFLGRKLEDPIKFRKTKPCDANYVGCTASHLYQRIEEHTYSAIGRHSFEHLGLITAATARSFNILKNCTSRFDCLIYEMFYTAEIAPVLSVQSDSVRAEQGRLCPLLRRLRRSEPQVLHQYDNQ